MDTETMRVIARLTEISEELLSIAEKMAAEGMPVFPAEAAEKVKQRICLQRGEYVPVGKKYTRGLSQAAYTETNRRLKEGTLDERDLIERGLLAPRDTPGRPKKESALDNLPSAKDPQRPTPPKLPTSQEAMETWLKYKDETEEETLQAMIERGKEETRKLNAPKEVVPKKKAAKKKVKKAAKKKGEG